MECLHATRPVGVGLIGCGSISTSYIRGIERSPVLVLKACASRNLSSAQAKAREFGLLACSVDELLADPEIEIVVNLTPPEAHFAVSRQILLSGKHLYSEKPLAGSLAEAGELLRLAEDLGRSVACAPDTFLGAAHQSARRLLDEGAIGRPLAGAVAVATPGPEHFHPNPAFLYRRGAGPTLDIGPYYVTQLVNLLGPVVEVVAIGSRPRSRRLVTSAPRAGTEIEVEVQTTVNGALLFESGANVAVTFSCDVWRHRRPAMEIYGDEGALANPEPNWFDGEVAVCRRMGEWTEVALAGQPYGTPNMTSWQGAKVADYRGVGVADLALAVRAGRAPRAGGALALHVLEVLLALERAAEGEPRVIVHSRTARPAPVPPGEGEEALLA